MKFDADLLLTLEDGKPRFHLEFPKKKKKWPWILLLLFIIISAGTIYAFIQTSPKDVKVPDVTNLTEADAKVKLAVLNKNKRELEDS